MISGGCGHEGRRAAVGASPKAGGRARYVQDRLGEQAQQVQRLATERSGMGAAAAVPGWRHPAVFHFLTSLPGQHRYVRVLDAATETDAVAVFGCFAPDGPQGGDARVSPVARYDIPALAAQLGQAWTLCAEDREEHSHPLRDAAVHLGRLP